MSDSSRGSSRRPSPAARLRRLAREDRPPIERILRATGAFTEDEVRVALELVDEGLSKADGGGYRFVVACAGAGVGTAGDEAVAGYACYGETPLTEGTWDLYWVAVDPALQGRGLGLALVRACEEGARAAGGRQLLIETASKPSYDATRAFYDRAGYAEVARVPDFYRPGDDKVVYARSLKVPGTDFTDS
jgi:ribosomal protein S18 acetylase RimI-like enzyme